MKETSLHGPIQAQGLDADSTTLRWQELGDQNSSGHGTIRTSMWVHLHGTTQLLCAGLFGTRRFNHRLAVIALTMKR